MTEAPIVVVSEPGRTPLHVVLVGPLEVGRDATGIILNDPAVSRRHLELRPDGSRVLVTDLGSANGTTLDGLSVDETVELEAGAIVKLGDTKIQLGLTRTAPQPPPPVAEEGLTTISRLAAGIASAPVKPPAATAVDGTVTIVFTDIESSTELAFSYGDERWFNVLRRHTEIVRTTVADHGGTEVKAQGDGFMLAFSSAHGAITCLIDVQRAVTELGAAEPDMAVTLRAGAHTGEVIVGDDGDIFGHHVNLAARISDQAAGGEIVVSSLVREIVESRGDLRFGDSRQVSLKGLSGTYLIHPVLWRNGSGS